MMSQSSATVNAKHVILVVDDDMAVRSSLKFSLEVEGFEVRAYSNARDLLDDEGLDAADCLVTDYQMPVMNGLELVARLRDRHMQIPAILITSLVDENLRNRAFAAGVPIVEKPVLGGRLLGSISEAIDGRTKFLS